MPVFSIRASIILDANGVRTKNHLTGYETALVELGRFVVKEKWKTHDVLLSETC
jgi:hypothetical protein